MIPSQHQLFFICASSLPPSPPDLSILISVSLLLPLIMQIRHCTPQPVHALPLPGLLSLPSFWSRCPGHTGLTTHAHLSPPSGSLHMVPPPTASWLAAWEGLSHPLCFRLHVIFSEKSALTTSLKISPPIRLLQTFGLLIYNLKEHIY